MSRAEQLARFLDEGDSKVLAELSKAVVNLENSIDQRFEAFDEVIQAIGDTIDSIEEKVSKRRSKSDDKAELAAIKAEVKKSVDAILRIRIPEQQKVDLGGLQKDVNMVKLGLAAAIREQDSLKSSIKSLSSDVTRLLTAKRTPVFDQFGNIIDVKIG